jgi:benzylsuccinate CoA-transferase BbsE subunit
VLELGASAACGFSARLFVQLGADVVKVEALPDGDPSRRAEPRFLADGAAEACGVAFHYLHQGKRSVALDLDEPETAVALRGLLEWAEVVLVDETFAASPSVRVAVDEPSSTVRTFVTPYGATGPYAAYAGAPGAVFALGGELAMLPGGLGNKLFPDAPPLLPRGNVPEFDGGLVGALVSLASLYHASPEPTDVAALEANASLNRWLISHYDESGWIETRGTRSYPYAGMFECADGYAMLQPSTEVHWENLVRWMGSPEWALKPEYATRPQRNEAGEAIRANLAAWLLTKTKQEILLGGLEFGVPAAPFRDAAEVHACEQFTARGFFVPYGDDEGASVPGLPFALTPFGEPRRRRAPDLGEHTEEVLALVAEPNPLEVA